MLAKHFSGKVVLSETYKGLLKLNKRKKKTFKMGKRSEWRPHRKGYTDGK